MRRGAVLLALLLCVGLCVGSVSFPVHRVLRYDVDGEQRGCVRAGVSSGAAAWSSNPGGDFSRSVVVFSHKEIMQVVEEMGEEEVDDASFQERLGGNASGVLVILPSADSGEKMGEEDMRAWMQVERQLLAHKLTIPVYFARDTPETHALLTSLSGASDQASAASVLDMLLKDSHQLIVNAPDGTQIKKPTLTNVYGWLGGATEALPVIMVVGSYDALSAAPSLSEGADANGSGLLGVMQLARAFSRLHRTHSMHWRYNLLFMLTDGGSFNHAGAEAWLAEADARLLSSVELVVNLDAIAGAAPLYLHASRPAKNPIPQRLYNVFSAKSTAEKECIVDIQKVNVSAPFVRYPHEHFSKKKIFSVTLSSRFAPLHDVALPGSGASVFEAGQALDVAQVTENVNLIGDVLLSFMFPDTVDPSMSVLSDALSSSPEFSQSFVEAFLERSRPPLVYGNHSDVVQSLVTEMSYVLSDVVAHEVSNVDLPFTLYTMSDASMDAFVVKPHALELVIFACTAVYLVLLYVGIKGKEALAEASSLLAAIMGGGKQKRS